jgi:hypothetical protein
VVVQQPHIAQPVDRLIGKFRDAVRIGPVRSQITQRFFELIRFEADQAEVELAELQVTYFFAEWSGSQLARAAS